MTKPKRLPPGIYDAKISNVLVREGSLEIQAQIPAKGNKEIMFKIVRIQKPKRRHR